MMLHALPPQTEALPSPEYFTYPFCYEPHPLCVAAAGEVRAFLATQEQWAQELEAGKMFGVLAVEAPSSAGGAKRGFLAAFSGTLDGKTLHPYFVPPVFDLMSPGCHFQQEQERISALNRCIGHLQAGMEESPLRRQMEEELEAFRRQMQAAKAERHRLRTELPPDELAAREPELIRQSQYQKAQYKRLQQEWMQRIEADEAPLRERQQQADRLRQERHERSQALQQWLFGQFSFLNARGQRRSLAELFHGQTPPSGAGECCAPRLLQAAYTAGLKPLCMAEFWVGRSPLGELRQEGRFYPACNSRCKPILAHMLQGLRVEPNPLLSHAPQTVEILWHDDEMAVLVKPHGMLSVPGKDGLPSVQDVVREMFPRATGPVTVHRLDMDTAGLMAVALTDEMYRFLQEEFRRHRVQKTYRALLEREMPLGQQGEIRLPLRPDVTDRPRQMVDPLHGRTAITYYKVLDNTGGHALVELHPQTGRTHQLRVHCAHPQGLGNPILGDRLYGTPAAHLCLQACQLTINGRVFTLPPDYELCVP